MPQLPDEGRDERRHVRCQGAGMTGLSVGYAVLQLIHATDISLYALVDGLQYERCFGEPLFFQQHITAPLFDRPPDSRIAFAGPWLIRIGDMTGSQEKLAVLEAALPSVSWLATATAAQTLVIHLQQNMNIVLPDGQAALLRLQDPRVLLRLAGTLDSQQHHRLTAPVHEWTTTVDGKPWSFKQRTFLC
ncbi:hypothetical protein A8H26_17915 [Pluralibacter gergoviae]|nr:hypothetical protein A8H26_17915 [Pluralibacter gergoviae]